MMTSLFNPLKGISLFLALLVVSTGISQVWEELSPSPFPDRHHAIGFSANGYGYIVSGSFNKDVWRYTPETDSWEQLDDYSNIFRGYGIGAMEGQMGYFGFGLTFGGAIQGEANDLWRFDMETESFEQLADCPCLPRAHPAFVLLGDKIYMGMGSNQGNLGDWWEYDIPSDTWTEKASFIGPNRHHPYQFVIGDYVYVGSGHYPDWYRYDPANDSWSQIASHPSYIRVAGIQFAYNGKGYTLSGVADYNNDDHIPMPTGEFWEYDPEADTWTELPPHPGISRWASASFIIDGWLYMVAGEVYDGNHNTYRYFLGEEDVTSVEENPSDEPLELFPMPFEDYVMLPADRNWVSAQLLDLSGSQVGDYGIDGQRLELLGLASGVYFIELSDGQDIYRQRVLKQ